MLIRHIQQDFHKNVSEKIFLENKGINRYRVFTLFLFDNSDNLKIS